MMTDLLVLVFMLACIAVGIQIYKDFTSVPRGNRYALPGDNTIRRHKLQDRKQRLTREFILLIMMAIAFIGAIIYFRSQ